jgi:curved DNA-binding protein CbpA
MPPQDPRHTYYKILMLAEIADDEIISTVYRKLARRFHPDVDASPEAARRMAEINQAYATLKDRDKRREYDRWLASRRDRRGSDRFLAQPGDFPLGPAGAPVGPPHGSVITFGRYSGWTLGQVRRRDPDFLQWLMRVPAGRQWRDEISAMLGSR